MLSNLQRNIHYTFRQVKLLQTALTHSSYSNEVANGTEHNERLEFLGDAVLELCISQELYRIFPEVREGELTSMRARLVNQTSLAQLARKLHLDKYLMLGKGEESQGGRDRDALISDAFEAVLGAVFLDGGFAAAVSFVEFLFAEQWGETKPVRRSKDYKSLLQELTQKHFRERPIYVLTDSHGPEHAKRFEVTLTLPDGMSLTSFANSVKRAEQQAAQEALQKLSDKLALN